MGRGKPFPWSSDEEMYALLDPIIRAVARMHVRGSEIGPDAHDADDLTSYVWIELLKSNRRLLNQWDPEKLCVESYVRMIAGSKVIDPARRATRRNEIAPITHIEDEPASDRPSPEVTAQLRQQRAQLDDCVRARLANRPRALDLYDSMLTMPMKDEEVLEKLNITQEMLYRLRHEVRTAIRKCEDDVQG